MIKFNSQKFQIGDICRVFRADNTLCFPPKMDKETLGYGCFVMIIGSYGQIFPQINPSNTYDYSVYILKHLNPQVYTSDKLNTIPNFGKCVGEFGWSWATDAQFDFGKYYDGKVHMWYTWEDMARQYINLKDD